MELLCPICKKTLFLKDKYLYCPNKHLFDIAKQGYINLNMKDSNNTGDEKEMIKSRHFFLNQNHYLFLKDKLNEIINNIKPNNLLDLACGEGHYTKSFNIKDKVGIDLSKEALKIASREDKNTTYILKNIFDVPIASHSVDLITTIFAPISIEILRLLKDDGFFLFVKPDYDHLYELKKVIYDNPYYNKVIDTTPIGLILKKEIKIRKQDVLDNDSLIKLFKMTPYCHKTNQKDSKKLNDIEKLPITFSFIIDIYQISK